MPRKDRHRPLVLPLRFFFLLLRTPLFATAHRPKGEDWCPRVGYWGAKQAVHAKNEEDEGRTRVRTKPGEEGGGRGGGGGGRAQNNA